MVPARWKVIEPLADLRSPYWEVANFNQYDILAIMRICHRLISERPDVVIAHGNRAINLVMPAVKRVAPFIAVNQHINLRRTVGADFAIAVNENMRSRLITEAGQPADRVFKFFNMVRRPAAPPPPAPLKSPPVIAAMGRFVAKKGFEVFIEALGRLNDQRGWSSTACSPAA